MKTFKGLNPVLLSFHMFTLHTYISQIQCLLVDSWIWNKAYRKTQYDATDYQNLLLHIYIKLNMFWATQHPSSGASSNHTSNNLPRMQTRGCQCSFRPLMMGGVLPETCWASYKYAIINFDTLLHLVGFFCMTCIMMHGSTNIKFMKQGIISNRQHTCTYKRHNKTHDTAISNTTDNIQSEFIYIYIYSRAM
jgi:hypothetical protein